jgi:hypothetical protein
MLIFIFKSQDDKKKNKTNWKKEAELPHVGVSDATTTQDSVSIHTDV